MGEVVTQPVTWEKWPEGKAVFETSADLFACVNDLIGAGHRGQVRGWPVEGQPPHWDLEVSATLDVSSPAIVAVLGQCVVLLGDTAEAFTPEQYAARFENGNQRSAKKKAAK